MQLSWLGAPASSWSPSSSGSKSVEISVQPNRKKSKGRFRTPLGTWLKKYDLVIAYHAAFAILTIVLAAK